jgi:transglutaminase-like putative cysteine protease
MPHSAFTVLVLGTLAAAAARAQAPAVGPGGDPSVASDTIYRLAVTPADYPDESYVYLLDDGVVRFEADGRGTRTYRQVVQILDQDGVEAWGELSFSYSGSREKLTVNWARVLRPDGTVVSERPTHEQESDVPAALEYPVYSDTKVRRATLGGLAPGLLVDYSYTVETREPVMPGDFFTAWNVTNARPTRRSRLIVDVPASLAPRIRERNVRFERRITVAHGRRVYEWDAQDVPKPPAREPFAADSDTVRVRLAVASPLRWADVARWYAGLVRGRFAVTPALDARLADAVKGAATALDSLRAVHRWVAQDFRYVSVALGLAGYQPRPPSATLETMYGDCKDKATLFIALAQRMGFRAYPVLLSASGGIDSTLPTTQAFDHMIAAVALDSGRVRAGGATNDSVNGRASSGAVALDSGRVRAGGATDDSVNGRASSAAVALDSGRVRAGGATNDSVNGRASSGAVERRGGYLYLDLTADEIPVGQLPESEYGEFALVVHPDGGGEAVTLPLDSAAANGTSDSLVGELRADGSFAGRLTTTLTGRMGEGLRRALSHGVNARQRDEFARDLANGAFEGAAGDSLQLFDGRDLGATPRISVAIRGARAASPAGGGSIFRLPLRPLFSAELVSDVESHVPRHYPIAVAAVIGPAVYAEDYRITLPPGWRAQLPAGVTATSVYGRYRSSYLQDGRTLTVERRVEGARGVEPPDRVAELLAFVRAIAQDDARLIVLTH